MELREAEELPGAELELIVVYSRDGGHPQEKGLLYMQNRY